MTGALGFPLSYATRSPGGRMLVAPVENLRGGNGLHRDGGSDDRSDNGKPNASSQYSTSQIETPLASDRHRPQHFAPFVAQILAQTLCPTDNGVLPTRSAYLFDIKPSSIGIQVDHRL